MFALFLLLCGLPLFVLAIISWAKGNAVGTLVLLPVLGVIGFLIGVAYHQAFWGTFIALGIAGFPSCVRAERERDAAVHPSDRAGWFRPGSASASDPRPWWVPRR